MYYFPELHNFTKSFFIKVYQPVLSTNRRQKPTYHLILLFCTIHVLPTKYILHGLIMHT